MTRRDLLKTSVAAAATFAAPKSVDAATRSRSVGANDRIRIAHLEAAAKADKHAYVEKPLAVEFIDLVHFITGARFPQSCVCLGTVNETWKDEHNFTNPNCIQATWTYPEGFVVSSSNNLCNSANNIRKLYGDKGALDITNWNKPTFDCEGAPHRDGSIRGKNEVTPTDHPDHYLNWLQCMRSGGTPNASIDAGYQHAVAVIMAMQSFETGRKTVYDPVKRTIKTT